MKIRNKKWLRYLIVLPCLALIYASTLIESELLGFILLGLLIVVCIIVGFYEGWRTAIKGFFSEIWKL